MQTWVCYDIADDARRERVVKALLDFGSRVEESVFQCRVDAPLADSLRARLASIIDESADKVHLLSLCEACSAKIGMLGLAEQAPDSESLII